MTNTSLCYIQHADSYLMIHRTKKQDDYNKDKWIGIGGKFEEQESPYDCVIREVFEETQIKMNRKFLEYRGIVTFICRNEGKEPYTEFMHLFWYDLDGAEGDAAEGRGDSAEIGETAGLRGESAVADQSADLQAASALVAKSALTDKSSLPDCPEGVLEWVAVDKMNELPHWKGDEIFLDLLAKKVPFFSLKLEYENNELVSWELD